MKKIEILVVLVMFITCIFGCGGKETAAKDEKTENKGHDQFLFSPDSQVYGGRINDLLSIEKEAGRELWIATDDGLYVQDIATRKTEHYTSDNTIIPDNRVHSLSYDAESGDVWISCTDGAVVYRDGKFRQKFTIGDVYAITVIKSLGQKEIWAGTHEGLKQFNGVNWKVFDKQNSGLMDLKVTCVSPGTGDQIWAGGIRGLHRIMSNRGQWERYTGPTTEYQGGSLEVVPGNSGLPANQINALSCDSKGNMWVATNRGLGLYINSTWKSYTADQKVLKMNFGTKTEEIIPGNSGICGNIIYDVFLDEPSNTVYCATNKGIAIFSNLDKWSTIDVSNSKMPSEAATAVCVDSKYIYAGTDYGLLIYAK